MILVNKSVRSGSITKILSWETKRVLQTEIPKVVAILIKGLGALLVGSKSWVDILPESMVILHVIIRATR